MNELEAARLVRAALDLIHAALPETVQVRKTVSEYAGEIDAYMEALDAPPWEPEPVPSVELPWSQVACGDSVQAPNGNWYEVDAWSRTGRTIKALLVYEGRKLPTVRDAGDKVPVRRGATGQAIDILRAGGLELTTIGASK